MSEITIVTAFFDIGRGQWQKSQRAAENYLQYFRFWARMQNQFVIYTTQALKPRILEIREEFHLREKTEVVVIDDVFACDKEIYERIHHAMQHDLARAFHKYPDHPESSNAAYNYITLLKSYFVSDAIKKDLAKGTVAWIDFGFNHGGETYVNPEEFAYLWNYNFSDKIHFFARKELDCTPIFQIVREMDVYLIGGIMVAPDHLWEPLWQLERAAMLHLTACGLADDDQTIMLMAYRERPDLFELHGVEDWLLPLKLYGGSHLTIQAKKKKSKLSIFWRDAKKKIKRRFGKL